MQYRKMASLVIGLAAAMLIAACSAGADDPTSAPTVAPAAETAAPDVAPAAPEGMFTGKVHCRVIATPSGGNPDAMYHACDQVATDPRMVGTVDLGPIVVSDYSELEPAFTAYGPSVITNDRGSWVCQEASMGISTNGVYTRDLVCFGKGEYVGLSAWLHSVTGDATVNWGFMGWIDKT